MDRFRFSRTLAVLAVLLVASILISHFATGETVAEGVILTPLTEDGKSIALAWAFHGDRIAFVS